MCLLGWKTRAGGDGRQMCTIEERERERKKVYVVQSVRRTEQNCEKQWMNWLIKRIYWLWANIHQVNVQRGCKAQIDEVWNNNYEAIHTEQSIGRINNDLQEKRLKGKKERLEKQENEKKETLLRKSNGVQPDGSCNAMWSRTWSWVELTGWWKWQLSEGFLCKLGPRALCFHPTCEVKWTVQSVLHNTNQQTTARVTQRRHFELVLFPSECQYLSRPGVKPIPKSICYLIR